MTRTDKLLDHYGEMRAEFADLVKWSAYCKMSEETRDKVPDDDFAGSNHSFPIRNQEDVEHAAMLLHHADDPTAVKKKMMEIIKRKGFRAPATWSHEST